MVDIKRTGPSTTTTGPQKTAGVEPPKKAEETVGDVDVDELPQANDKAGIFDGLKGAHKAVVDQIDGALVSAANKVVPKFDEIPDLKPGESIEWGREIELEANEREGAGEMTVGVERNEDGSYTVSADVTGEAGGELGPGSGGAGTHATVSFHAKDAKEAQKLAMDMLSAAAAGTVNIGSDGPAAAILAVVDHEHAESAEVGVHVYAAVESSSDDKGFTTALKKYGFLPKLEGEGTVGVAIGRDEKGTYVETQIEVEGDATLASKLGLDVGVGAISGKATRRVYVNEMDPPLTDAELMTEAGQRRAVAYADSHGESQFSFEGEARAGKHVVKIETPPAHTVSESFEKREVSFYERDGAPISAAIPLPKDSGVKLEFTLSATRDHKLAEVPEGTSPEETRKQLKKQLDKNNLEVRR